MKKLDLNFPITQINGEAFENEKQTVGQLFANALVSQAKGDPLKYYGWGILLATNKPIELDESDLQTLKEFVRSSENMTILLKGPVMQAISKL